jgi:radical SAM protein with 4Fe4S-binding SPASM domain
MRMDCGNLKERSFIDIWENAAPFQRLRTLKIAEVYGCNRCEVRGYCSACPGLFFMEMGDVLMPSPHACEMAEMKYQAATGVYKPCGARDEQGNFPQPVNEIVGSLHEPLVRKLKGRGLATARQNGDA